MLVQNEEHSKINDPKVIFDDIQMIPTHRGNLRHLKSLNSISDHLGFFNVYFSLKNK